jgi:hypothetical protein
MNSDTVISSQAPEERTRFHPFSSKAMHHDHDRPKVIFLENSRGRGLLLIEVVEGEMKLHRFAVPAGHILDLDSQSKANVVQAFEGRGRQVDIAVEFLPLIEIDPGNTDWIGPYARLINGANDILHFSIPVRSDEIDSPRLPGS